MAERENMKDSKNKITTKKVTVKNRIICMIMVIITLGTLCSCGSRETKPVEDYFVKYENATTLVGVSYGEPTLLGYKNAYGFIDDDIYEKYMNGEYEGKIKLYHPYKNGESVTVDAKTIVLMQSYTYKSFYEDFSPSIYGK